MVKLLSVVVAFLAMSASVAYLAHAGFTTPHSATGSVNTAVAATELLYICVPSGTTTDPICPIDAAGANEDIFVSSEDLLPGSVRWQKIRVQNVGADPWDLLPVSETWGEVSDPGGMCNVIPEGVYYFSGQPNVRASLVTSGITVNANTPSSLNDPSKDFQALGVQAGDTVAITSGTGQGQSRTITAMSIAELTVSPNWSVTPNASSSYDLRHHAGPGVMILGQILVPVNGTPSGSYLFEPVEGATYDRYATDDHALVNGSGSLRRLTPDDPLGWYSAHVEPGDYEDLLLGLRLPVGTPDDCLNVVWQLNTTWDVQVHAP